MKKSLHNGHRQRLKNRFLQEGLQSFEDHEVLQLILFYAIPYKDTNEIAHKLINKFGSLSKVVEANPKDLEKISGISEHSSILISLFPHFIRKYMADRGKEKLSLDSSKKAGEFACSLYYGISYEVFYVICLDAQHNLLHYEIVHEGTIDEAPIYPRLIVESALRHKAHSIILSHNHPGETMNISESDINATKRIISALAPIEIDVIDHIIIAGNRYISFSEQKIIV
ncbi:hypothetical protein CLHOM_35840 [Clostridium homopropionicum DSM 5847]|uniref:MPN domain-containing protein n=1 Tax=Clostridium homopropionicum DSM 5847 TaxID=1121318 RepID=A0A0L6Z536_9CLOT|nr:DNA repair protein RadC [Clostridium homopropionicum]KOA18071.1 hypothetical protein CLHOM_35840 [Clostridium homopropionicum DSM 5847]SFH01101.1 DNA repair protein RadC [Clostridium homopropionicum]